MAVLKELARYSDWSDGTHAEPAIDTITVRTALSRISVQRALISLSCHAARCGRQRCQQRGLIVCTAPSTARRPAMYAITLAESAMQPHLPEVGASLGSARGVLGMPQTRPGDVADTSVGS